MNNQQVGMPVTANTQTVAHPTDEFMAFVKKHNVKFEDAAAARQKARRRSQSP